MKFNFPTIVSPGVQITEQDLSLRANLPAGTSVVVPGFASQGPTSEPILITSVAELEATYGTPKTAAERYFYNSCTQVLNSPATLTTIRLPYGNNLGTDFALAYSGLFYPATQTNVTTTTTTTTGYTLSTISNVSPSQAMTTIALITSTQFAQNIVPEVFTESISNGLLTFSFNLTSSNTVTVSSGGGWQLGTPIHITLSGTAYQAFKNGNITWNGTGTGNAPSFATDGVGVTANAGFIVLNSLQTVINENSEGYYVGFTNNATVGSTYNAITGIQTLNTTATIPGVGVTVTTGDTFAPLPSARFDTSVLFTQDVITANYYGLQSISEALQNVGFAGFNDGSTTAATYNDEISLAVFKVKRSTVDGTILNINVAEKYLGSFDYARRVNSPTGGNLANAYIGEIINSNSALIQVHVNPQISKQTSWIANTSTGARQQITIGTGAQQLYPIGVYTPDITTAADTNKVIGNVPSKLDKVLTFINNPENTTVDVIIDAGLSTIYATTNYFNQQNSSNVNYDETAYVPNPGTTLKNDWTAVGNTLVNFAQNIRKDCIAILDPLRQIFVTGSNTKVGSVVGNTFTQNIYNQLQSLTQQIVSNYATMYGNWVQIQDSTSGRNVWIPFSGFAAAVIGNNDQVATPWSAPAGLNRGGFQALDLAFNPNQKQRDKLYTIAVNPVVHFSTDGFVVFGQKTLTNKPSAFDRINVRRLFLALERSVQRAVKYFVFEPNTSFTRTRLVNTITPVFNQAKITQGVYDFLIVCDERNNTPDVIDQNQLIVDIYIKPVRTAEFINVNFIATTTSQDFNELI